MPITELLFMHLISVQIYMYMSMTLFIKRFTYMLSYVFHLQPRPGILKYDEERRGFYLSNAHL